MAPRLSKRQQREREELEELGGPSKLHTASGDEGDSEEEQSPLGGTDGLKTVRGFAALAEVDKDQEVATSDEDKPQVVSKPKKSKKKKKKSVVNSDHDPLPPPPKNVKVKKPKVEPRPKHNLKADDDDFDRVLLELSGRHKMAESLGSVKTSALMSSLDALNALFSVSLKNLDPEAELRRFFGSKVISSSNPTHRSPRAQASGRSHLARPQQTWPPPHYRAGLSMRALASAEVEAKGTGVGPDQRERWWTFEASSRYKASTYEFMQCVMGGDPQLFFTLLREMPWHADTLLQTAEVFRHREEYSAAADFLLRVLFAYERGFTAAFNLTTGIHRLDFDHVENRIFYLAISRNIVDLNRRGTPRTAFEFARLLLALDPHTDPHGALLHLDCLAIKAGQASWLLDMWDTCSRVHELHEVNSGEVRFDVTMMPGWHWARALALFDKETDGKHETSAKALLSAVVAFPSVLPLLADKADIAMPAELRKLDAFRIVTDYSPYSDDLATSLIHLLSHIYALRSAPLWKQAPRAAWLSATLKSLSTELPQALSDSLRPARIRLCTLFSGQSNVTDAAYRHVVVVAPLVPEFRHLMGFFPAEVKDRLAQTIEGDPLPPVTAVSTYSEAYFAGLDMEGRGSTEQRLVTELRRLFPDAIDRRQFQALFDAHPEIGAQFPGGVVELAQIARQFPQEMLDAFLAMVEENEARAVEELGEGVPGGGVIFAEHETEPQVHETDAVDDDDDDDDEDEDHQSFSPVRMVRTLLSRLWGRRTQVESDSDFEDAREAPRDGPPVDDVD